MVSRGLVSLSIKTSSDCADLELGTRAVGRVARDLAEVDVRLQRHPACVDLQDREAIGFLGQIHEQDAVEATGAKQRCVDALGHVGRADHQQSYV